MKTNLLLITVFTIFFGCNGYQNQQESLPKHGLLWEITGNGIQTPSYLFGTYHGQGGMSILDSIKSFDSIFTSTNQFICEIEFKNAFKWLSTTKTPKSDSSTKPWPVKDSTYVNLLTDKQKSILDSAINKDESLRIIREWNYRPVQAVSYIKYRYQKKAKKAKFHSKENSANDSIRAIILDSYLQQQAIKYNMNIEELDSMEEIQMLKDSVYCHLPTMSYKTEVEYMIYYIQNYQKIESLQKEYMNKLLTLYLQQDLGLFGQQQKEVSMHNNLIVSFLGNDNFLEIQNKMLIDERNNLWMKKIPALIEKNSSFIAVGAGHLAGESGLINQLRRLGYSVAPIDKTKD